MARTPDTTAQSDRRFDVVCQAAKRHWQLDTSLTFLNHGSFGACPLPVLDYQTELRNELEHSPVQFMRRRLPELLEQTRVKVAEFVGANPSDIVFVSNATNAVNAVLRSLDFEPGAELLTTNHLYSACHNALEYVAARSGLSVVVAEVPFPLRSSPEVTKSILERVTPKTRLALIDHVTSITGLVWPIAEIARELEARGVATLIDGAHAPGMLELDLTKIGASYYAANFHKWVSAPKGAGMLWVRPDRQSELVPLVVSHGYRAEAARFSAMFDWQGTSDPTPMLAVARALEFMAGLVPGGWPALRAHNRALALEAQGVLCAALACEAPAPADMLGSLCSIPLGPRRASAALLYERLLARGFETLVQPWPDAASSVLRVSAQVYNTPREFRALARVLPEILDAD